MSQNCMDEGPNNETIKISIFHKFQHSPFWYLDQKYILHYFNKYPPSICIHTKEASECMLTTEIILK